MNDPPQCYCIYNTISSSFRPFHALDPPPWLFKLARLAALSLEPLSGSTSTLVLLLLLLLRPSSIQSRLRLLLPSSPFNCLPSTLLLRLSSLLRVFTNK